MILQYKKGSQLSTYLRITNYIQQNLHYATYRGKKRLKLTTSGATLGYIDRHYVLDAQISLE